MNISGEFSVNATQLTPSKSGTSFSALDNSLSPSISEFDSSNLKPTRKKSSFLKENSTDNDSCVFPSAENGTGDILGGVFHGNWDVEKIEDTESEEYSKAQYIERPEGTYVVLKHGETIHFYGLFTMKVIHGSVEVLGFKLEKTHKYPMYSPRGAALLYVRNVNTSTSQPELNLLQDYPEKCSIFLVLTLQDHRINFVEKHVSQKILPPLTSTRKPRVEFEPTGFNLIRINPKWDTILESISSDSKVFICGGKGVGKSTCLRYSINKLLQKFEQVIIFDLDPGQAEFTPPGCLSEVRITKPVFGPNYTHLKNGAKSFVCDINVANDPRKYLETVKYLLNSAEPAACPVLFNYMGFTQDLGLNIVASVIALVKPTIVIQIDSSNAKKNFRVNITPKTVAQHASMLSGNIDPNIDYNLIKIKSECDANQGIWSMAARDGREMCILSYLHGIIKSDSIFNSEQALFTNKLSRLNITDIYGRKVAPAVINASLVALCQKVHSSPVIHNILGWGIVRGIDLEQDKLVLLCSTRLEVLKNVTDLVYCEILLPPSIYMTPDGVVGEMPYVAEGSLTDFGQITKRNRIPVKVYDSFQ